MQFEPENYRKNTLADSLQQLAAGIGGELQQRRGRMQNAYGLQQAFPEMSNQKAEGLSYLDPQTLSAYVKEQLKQPMYESMGSFANQMINQGQGQPTNGQQSPMDVTSSQIAQPGSTMPIGSQSSNQSGMGRSGVGVGSEQIGGLNPGSVNLPKKMTPQMAQMAIKENADYRKIQESRRTNDLKEKKQYSKEIDQFHADAKDKKATLQHVRNIKRYWDSGQVISGATKKWLDNFGLGEAITNAPTQAAIKDMNEVVIGRMSNTKGFRGTNLLANLIQKTKPSEYNTKEGVKPILDGFEAVLNTDAEIDELKAKEWNRLAKNPSMADADKQLHIQKDLEALDDKLTKRLEQISNKAIGYSANEENTVKPVKSIAAAKSYNTFKDGKFYRRNGVFVGSDGIRERKLAMSTDPDTGRPVPSGFADEE